MLTLNWCNSCWELVLLLGLKIYQIYQLIIGYSRADIDWKLRCVQEHNWMSHFVTSTSYSHSQSIHKFSNTNFIYMSSNNWLKAEKFEWLSIQFIFISWFYQYNEFPSFARLTHYFVWKVQIEFVSHFILSFYSQLTVVKNHNAYYISTYVMMTANTLSKQKRDHQWNICNTNDCQMPRIQHQTISPK